MNTAHRIEIKANNKQRTYFARAAGTARFSYNWALCEWKKEYEAGGKPTEAALRRKLNSIKKTEFPWMSEVTKNAPQEAIRQLGGAFKRFFKGESKYPKPREKGWTTDLHSVTISSTSGKTGSAFPILDGSGSKNPSDAKAR